MKCTRKMSWIRLVAVAAMAGALFACATAPQVKYAIEAERVKVEALEPVMLDSTELRQQLGGKYSASLSTVSADQLMEVLKKEIANTRRFSKVLVNISEGTHFVIHPRIERLEFSESPLSYDPHRKKVVVKAKVSAAIVLPDMAGKDVHVKTFEDERKLERMVPIQDAVTPAQKQEFSRRTIETAFRSLADQIGHEFNPSYEMGTVSRIDGRIAYVQINTTGLATMKKNERSVSILDEEDNVVASLEELNIGDGSLSGKFYAKAGKSVREGMKVRARIKSFN